MANHYRTFSMISLSSNSFIVVKINLYNSQQKQNGHCSGMLGVVAFGGYFQDLVNRGILLA